MSGGSMDYACYEVENAARMAGDPEFADMLRDAAKVLHDEEWWRSCDIGEEEYRATLAWFKAKWFGDGRSERLKGYVDEEVDRCRRRCYSIIGPVEALRAEGE